MTVGPKDFPPSSTIRQPGLGPISTPEERPLQPFLDRDLTVYKDGVRWAFSGGKVLANGIDVNYMLSSNPADIAMWVGMADGLNEYRQKISKMGRDSDQFAQFGAVIETLLGKILGQMKKIYDQKMSGMNWKLENGQFLLNGINIRSFMAMYRLRKTDKARKFLRGLKKKLEMILENPRESPDYERIHDVVADLHGEIHEALMSDEAPRAVRRLVAGRAGAS